MKTLLILVIAFMVTGCATVFNGTMTDVTILTRFDKDQDNTYCTLTNEEGSWGTSVGVPASVHRDGENLFVSCENGTQTGTTSAKSSLEGGYIAANLIVGGGILFPITTLIDAGTNAAFEYPSVISVRMRDLMGLDKKAGLAFGAVVVKEEQ